MALPLYLGLIIYVRITFLVVVSFATLWTLWSAIVNSHTRWSYCFTRQSPIRDPKHIDEAIERLERSTLSTLASVCALPRRRHDNIKHVAKDGSLVTALRTRRQNGLRVK